MRIRRSSMLPRYDRLRGRSEGLTLPTVDLAWLQTCEVTSDGFAASECSIVGGPPTGLMTSMSF